MGIRGSHRPGHLSLFVLQTAVLAHERTSAVLDRLFSLALYFFAVVPLLSRFFVWAKGGRHLIGTKPPPAHRIGVIAHCLDVDSSAIDEVAYVVLWCFAAGVREVLLFEPSGRLKEEPKRLLRRLHAYASTDSKFKVRWQEAKLQMQSGKDGFTRNLDPAFVMVIGDCLSIAGYPPWALRTSEMYHIGPLQSISQASIQATLRQYNRTVQRFGT